MIRIFIGFDPREAVAYHVLAHSILRRSSQPVSITPLCLSSLGSVLARPRNPLQSTDFSFSRFLTPYLSGYEGHSVQATNSSSPPGPSPRSLTMPRPKPSR